MVQWIDLHRNNSFVNRTQLPMLCKKSGVMLLVLVGFMTGRPAIRRNTGRFENFKNSLWIASVGFSRLSTKVQCYYSVTNYQCIPVIFLVYCETSY